MLVHSVFFWLRDDLSADDRARFVSGVQTLPGISWVRHGSVGVPAPTDRPIIDRSYSYALTLMFDDLAAHDAYQVDPAHEKFVSENKGAWSKIVIYDAIEE